MNNRLFRVMGLTGLVLVLATCEGDQGPIGPEGPSGAPGTDGATGVTGPAGVSGWEIVTVTQSFVINAPTGPEAVTVRVDCPTGKQVLGGGHAHVLNINDGSFGPGQMEVTQNYPSSATSWTVTFTSGYVLSRTVTVYAICGFAT
jgi:hypothetical protein